MTCLGHLIFLMLHLAAILFGLVGLFITIPGHVLFAALTRKR